MNLSLPERNFAREVPVSLGKQWPFQQDSPAERRYAEGDEVVGQAEQVGRMTFRDCTFADSDRAGAALLAYDARVQP